MSRPDESRRMPILGAPEAPPDPNAPAAPPPPALATTHRETFNTPASVGSVSGLQSTYSMDEFRRDGSAFESEGNAALATAPTTAPAFKPGSEPYRSIFPQGSTTPMLELVEKKKRRASTTPWMERARTFANHHPIPVAIGLIVVAIGTVVLYSVTRGPSGMSIGELKRRSVELDAQTVTVQGRIGEVFQMGSSYAYYLQQGRDTVVVFTRTSHPVPRDRVTVTGSVSTGYLEGVPRVALFQTTAKK